MAKWEYSPIAIRLSSSTDEVAAMTGLMKTYGDAGWELVSMVHMPNSSASYEQIVLAFKRPLHAEVL